MKPMISSARAFPAVLLAACLTWLPLARVHAQAVFLSGIADLPLMPGLAEQFEAGLVFDNQDGRIVRATAIGRLQAAAVRRYYRAALPALGWRPVGADRYLREGELLRLELMPRDGGIAVGFALAPSLVPSRAPSLAPGLAPSLAPSLAPGLAPSLAPGPETSK